MKKTKSFLFVMILFAGFINCCRSQSSTVTVTVLDEKSHAPVENAQVSLQELKNATDVNLYKKNSNRKGKCSFPLKCTPDFQYNLVVAKDGCYPCYPATPENIETSFKPGVRCDETKVTLFLTSDSTRLSAYYASITPHFPIDSLVLLLKQNKYLPKNRFCLPALNWSDIPRLLELGKEEEMITNFPRNLVSSYDQRECPLGAVALWMIESIRISEGRKNLSPQDRFPSQFPVFSKENEKEPGPSSRANTPENLRTAYLAYLVWWKHAKKMDRREACKIDPLKNSGVSW